MINPQHPDFSCTPVSTDRARYKYRPVQQAELPYVSIITPFYNTGAIFHETACSVLQQSFQQWEWLIVNDASSDPDSLAVLDAYRQTDPRIRVIDCAENKGPGAVRNTGFLEARAPYVAQLDSDDLLEPTAIEKWVWFLESYPEYSFVKGYSVGFGAQEYLWQVGFHVDKRLFEENLIELTCLIRTAIHEVTGGYDETIRDGFEDWDFWLHCANLGYWGTTIPEYLSWYRRRSNHGERWGNWDAGQRQHQFQSELRRRYPDLWKKGIPTVQLQSHRPYASVPDSLPFPNHLDKDRPRMLLILPWMVLGGADKFNLDLLKLLVKRYDYEVTIATTLISPNAWMPIFSQYTSDIFVLNHFLRFVDYPRFLRYLIQSRQIDTVLISNSYLGYQLLPYLRAHCPDVTFMDYIHMEEEYWKNGGYPRASLNHAEQLDLTVVSSNHLKQWMTDRGGEATRIHVCTTNIDTADWDPARYDRAALRQALGLRTDEAVILYAGRISQQKQPGLFAEVMRELSQRQLPFVCLVAGDGPERATLEQFLTRHQLRQVRLLGAVSNQRMRELLALSDLFFLPSEMEGISLAIYEAMAMGVAVVGADVGGQSELVTPECGMLVARAGMEQAAYVAALDGLLRDPVRRRAMGTAARARVQAQFQLEQMGARMVAIIDQAHDLARMVPRPTVPRGLALDTATQAIEHTRLEQLADQLWTEREALLNRKPARHELGRYIRLRVARAVKKTLRPIYRWALRNGMGWLAPIRNRIHELLTHWLYRGAT